MKNIFSFFVVVAMMSIGLALGASRPNGPALAQIRAAEVVPPERILSGIAPDVPDGLIIVEGDMQIPIEEFERRLRAFADSRDPLAPEGTYTFTAALWANGTVPYEFDANVSGPNRAAMQTAMTQWSNAAGVAFNQCASNTCAANGYLHIQSSTVNNSPVGRRPISNVINIVSWGNTWIMAHELGHSLGYLHEQSRPDRDTFVTINFGNVCKAGDPAANCNGGVCLNGAGARIDCDFNFAKVANSNAYGFYDFDSVMHYGRADFSRGQNPPGTWLDTITVKLPYSNTWQNSIGQRTHLSTMDLTLMGMLYPFNNWRFVDVNAAPGGTGLTFFSPYQSFYVGNGNVPAGGTVVVQPGTYDGAAIYYKQQTWWAPIGGVVIK